MRKREYQICKSVTINQKILRLLRDYESRNVTVHRTGRFLAGCLGARQGRSRLGCRREEVSRPDRAFGVAAAGHANPSVVKAGQNQMARLLHAMGDVHPHALKAELARELSRITFERWSTQHGKANHRQNHFLQFRL